MMQNKKKYEFDVETLQYGQPRPYADSIYDFIVESEQPERYAKYILETQKELEEPVL